MSQKPSFAQGRAGSQEGEEDDVPIKSFGKVKVELPRHAGNMPLDMEEDVPIKQFGKVTKDYLQADVPKYSFGADQHLRIPE